VETVYEQLFDMNRDPWEINNEIGNPVYATEAETLRRKLAEWEANTEAAPIPTPAK
jgi:hypothetical protein